MVVFGVAMFENTKMIMLRFLLSWLKADQKPPQQQDVAAEGSGGGPASGAAAGGGSKNAFRIPVGDDVVP